jgi:hypothetical protein
MHRTSHRNPYAWGNPLYTLLLLTLPLSAQTATTGAIAGHLPASFGSPAGARITAANQETGLTAHAPTSSAGDFLLTPLPPGDYTIDVSGPNLLAHHQDHVPVSLGLITELRFRPTPPEAPPTLDLPPNLRANPDSDAEGESLPSFRGLPSDQNSLILDGADLTRSFTLTPPGSGAPIDPTLSDLEDDTDDGATSRTSTRSVRSAAVPFTFARSAIREFHLTGDTFSALYGSSPGGILTAVSRSGSKHLHGQLFLQVRNSAFAATDPYAINTTYLNGLSNSVAVKPQDAREQLGASAGGPISLPRLIRSPSFFFGAVDIQRRNFPAISSPLDPNFYSLTPTQTALLANRGVRQTSTAAALTYLASLTGPTPRRSDGAVEFLRLDSHPASRISTNIQYNRARWEQPAGVLSAPVIARARNSFGNSSTKVDTLTAALVLDPTLSLSNDLRFQYGRELESQSPQQPLPQEPAIGPGGLAPQVTIGPQGLTFGTPASLGRSAYPKEHRLQLTDLISFTHRRHHLQAGADFAATQTYVAALPNQQGTFQYDSVPTTPGRDGGLVDWITDYTFNVNAYPNGGCPSITAAIHLFCFRSFTQSFGQQTVAFNTQQWAGFTQETFTLRPNLTLHAGLRYDYQLLPLPQQPNLALDALFGAQASTSVFPEDRNNLAPRAAISWQPHGPRFGTVRIGYGLFYGRVPGATLRAALLNTDLPTSTTHIRILPSTITQCPQVTTQNQGFGYPCAYETSPASALSNATSATVFSRRFRLPAVQQASFTYQRDLPASIELTATYRLNLDRQLPNSTDLNITPSPTLTTFQLQGGLNQPGIQDGETFVLPLYTTRLTSTVGPVTAITSTADAIYHGATLEFRRSTRTLSFFSLFTWSRATDFNPSQGAIPRTTTHLDPFNPRYDKALSDLNFPFRFTLNAAWQPHLTAASHELRAIANGWTLTPILLVRSGSPYSLTLSGGTRLPGGSESINGSGGALYLPTVGRNTLRLPPTTNLDLRLARTLRLRESLRLSLSAEAYNLDNHVNIAGITQRAYLAGTTVAGVTPLVFQNAAAIATEGLNTRPFGAFTDAGSSQARARELQFGLRLDF